MLSFTIMATPKRKGKIPMVNSVVKTEKYVIVFFKKTNIVYINIDIYHIDVWKNPDCYSGNYSTVIWDQ